MAPQNKTTSSSEFVYELNNFNACVNIVEAPREFHNLMKYLGQCKLVYAMTEALVLICEVIEKVWTTATYNTTRKVTTRKTHIDITKKIMSWVFSGWCLCQWCLLYLFFTSLKRWCPVIFKTSINKYIMMC